MADTLATIQGQINGQMSAIGAALSGSGLTMALKNELSSSAAGLQAILDKIALGSPLSTADQQILAASLDGSQKAILAAQARRTQWEIFGITSFVVVGLSIYLIVRAKKKKA